MGEAVNIAIIGSRNFKNISGIEEFMGMLPKNSVIISGGAPGVDRAAERFAKKYGYKTKIFKADWQGLGKSAGIIRNRTIVENSDYVIAFWDQESKGTASSIALAKELNKKLIVIADS